MRDLRRDLLGLVLLLAAAAAMSATVVMDVAGGRPLEALLLVGGTIGLAAAERLARYDPAAAAERREARAAARAQRKLERVDPDAVIRSR